MRETKPKLCKYCGVVFKPFKSTQPCCPKYECIKTHNSPKEVDKRVKELKEEVKTLSWWESKARTVFQKWIRLTKGNECISCQSVTSKIDAGHFFSAEAYTGLIFNEDNVWPQCHHCNRILHGNFHEYKKGLIKRIGPERVYQLESIVDFNRVKRLTRDEYKEIITKYNLKIKQLEK
jgi:hypothetical protein